MLFNHSQWRGRLKYIEQNELYSSKDIPSPTRDPEIAPKLAKYREVDGAKPIIDSLKSVRLPDNILEPVLHGRSLAMNEFSEAVVQFVQNSTLGDAAIPQQEGSIVQQEISGNSSPSSVSTSADDTLALSSPCSSISDTGSTNLISVGCQTSFTSHLSTPSSIQVDSSMVTGAASDMDSGIIQPCNSGDKLIEQRQQQVSFINPLMSNQYLPVDGSFSADNLYNSAMTLTSTGQEPFCDRLLGVALPSDDGYSSPLGTFSPIGSTAATSSIMSDTQSYNHSPELETMQYSTLDSDPIPSQFSPQILDSTNSTSSSQIPSNFDFLHSTSTPLTDSAGTSHIPDLSMLHEQQHGSCPPINPSGAFTQLAMIEEPNYVGFNSFPVNSTNSTSLPQDQGNTQDPNSFCTQAYEHDELLLSTTDTGDIQDILEQFL